MKSILAFGDSLTWGVDTDNDLRHDFENRWPNVLAAGLNKKARVYEEGMNGRTTVFPDPTTTADRNGATALPILLATHQPLDLVIIMLGLNDIKFANRCTAFDASLGMERLIKMTKTHDFSRGYQVPQILIMAPPCLVKSTNEWFNELWSHAFAESKRFVEHYARVANEQGVHFFDTGSVAHASDVDGGHLDADNTIAIGKGLVPIVKKILEI